MTAPRAAAVFAVLVAALIVWRAPLLGPWIAAASASLQQMGPGGLALFGAAYVLAEVALVPGSLLTLAAGFAFGPIKGLLVVSPASVIAATIAFGLSRTLLRSWARRRIDRSALGRAVSAGVHENSFKLVLLLRLSPVIPFNLLNYALGLSDVPVTRYVAASFIGMLPGTFLYVYLGSLASDAAGLAAAGTEGGPARTAMMVVGLAATITAVAIIGRTARRGLRTELGA